jgi:hypothetical protein
MVSPTPRSFGDFLRRISFDYVRYGYYRYAVRTIPSGKDLPAIDEKLRRTYHITSCRTTRTRMRRRGLSTVQYLRLGQTFVLLATAGHHEAFDRLRSYDIRQSPLHLGRYSIGISRGSVHIKVTRRVWRRVKRLIRRRELRPHEEVERLIKTLPFYNFPGVTQQKRTLLRQVNRRRKRAGLPKVNLPSPSKDQYVNARNNCLIL